MDADLNFENDVYLNEIFSKSRVENKKRREELIRNIYKYEEYLFENLDDEKLEVLERYIQVQKELQGLISAESYRDGYKMCMYSVNTDNKKAK